MHLQEATVKVCRKATTHALFRSLAHVHDITSNKFEESFWLLLVAELTSMESKSCLAHREHTFKFLNHKAQKMF